MFLRTPIVQSLGKIPDGKSGINATLRLMSRCVKVDKTNPRILGTALELISGLAQKDFTGEVQALFDFVQKNVRYTRDVTDVETVRTPLVMLDEMAGDCDDKSTLLAALLEAVGHVTRFVAVGFSPNNFEHVFIETRIGNHWVALDATEPYPMGWRPPDVQSFMIWHN